MMSWHIEFLPFHLQLCNFRVYDNTIYAAEMEVVPLDFFM